MEGKISFELEWDKFAAAVAYLTERSRNDDNFGVVKLVIAAVLRRLCRLPAGRSSDHRVRLYTYAPRTIP